MEYAWYYDLVLMYVVYSFLGWVAETVVSAARGRGFVDRGFAAGPFCYVYGFAAVIMAVGFDDLRGSLGYLFLGCVTVATVVEWFAAKILERLHHRTWWDYSGHRFNIDGYVCLPYSLLWGVLGCLSVLWGNDLLRALFHLMPVWLFRTLAWVLGILALLDQLGSAALLRHRPTPLEGLNRALERQARTLYDRIALRIERQIEGAYPHAVEKPAALEGRTLGEALLAPTKIYVKPVLAVLEQVHVRGISHITGGGFYENIPRSLKKGCCARIRKSDVRTPALFGLLQEAGGIPERDMFNTFNMGVGMVLTVPADEADKALEILHANGEPGAYRLGVIAEGEGVELW